MKRFVAVYRTHRKRLFKNLSPATKKCNKIHEKMTSIVVFDLLGNIIWWVGLIYIIIWYFFSTHWIEWNDVGYLNLTFLVVAGKMIL